MAALKQCERTDEHEFHGWHIGAWLAEGTKYYVCRGIPADPKDEQ